MMSHAPAVQNRDFYRSRHFGSLRMQRYWDAAALAHTGILH
jgi:hypothetical protein